MDPTKPYFGLGDNPVDDKRKPITKQDLKRMRLYKEFYPFMIAPFYVYKWWTPELELKEIERQKTKLKKENNLKRKTKLPKFNTLEERMEYIRKTHNRNIRNSTKKYRDYREKLINEEIKSSYDYLKDYIFTLNTYQVAKIILRTVKKYQKI